MYLLVIVRFAILGSLAALIYSLFNGGYMTEQQIFAIKCAVADLIGIYQAYKDMDFVAHDWEAHKLSIEEMLDAFPDDLSDYKNII